MSFKLRFSWLALTVVFATQHTRAQPADEVPIEEEEGDEIPVDSAPPPAPGAPKAPAAPQAPAQAPKAPKAPAAPSKAPAAAAPGAEGEEGAPDRPPARGKGVVWGVLTDTRLNEPLIEAEVSATAPGKKEVSVFTDLDGRFRLELDPGTYEVRFWAELHRAEVVKGVVVEANTVAELNSALIPDDAAIDVIEVETEADRAAVEGQILKRQRSAATGDSVGRAEMGKTPDSNAAEAAQRVVGATIVGDRFVYVRGLGERYSNALLNGAPVPSPEPDINAVPLDLFPALVLESVTIAKTFTPDVPGDFAGGSVRIDTREIPGNFLFSAGTTLGLNTQATFQERLSYRGGGTDWLAFDDGTRALPDGLSPGYQLARSAEKPGFDPADPNRFVTPTELEYPGEQLNTFMSTTRTVSPPNHNGNIVIGNGWDLGGGRRFGVLGALTYSRSFTKRSELLREFRATATAASGRDRQTEYDVEHGNDAVRWGAFGSASYRFSPEHQLTLSGLHSQASDNSAWQFAHGFNAAQAAGDQIHNTRLRFVSRALDFGQLRGEHEFVALDGGKLDWNLALSRAARDEPDTRDTVYIRPEMMPNYLYLNSSESGRHFFATQSERGIGGGLDWTQPVVKGDRETSVKFGGLISLKDREFNARRFALKPAPMVSTNMGPFVCGPEFDPSCPDRLFTNRSIGPLLLLEEGTRATDAYEATLDVYAAYFMADASVAKDLRVILGERLEATSQTIEPIDQFDTGVELRRADLQSTDLLPALGVVYSATKQSKLRASITRTLARPQLRELAPFEYSDYFAGRQQTGNPDLKLTRIINGDLRFELYPTIKEVLAVSFFVKRFQDPIEPLVRPGSSQHTVIFQNAEGANLLGVELEGRKSLDFLHEELDLFTAILNLTLARSRIEVEQTGVRQAGAVGFITNTTRPLVNQAPWVVNAAIDYEAPSGLGARVLYNVSGPALIEVGTDGLEDAYVQPRHTIDLTLSQELGKHFKVKATVENVLNSEYRETQGTEDSDDALLRRYRSGSVYSIGASYTN